jgi:hypothetical protein
MRKVRGIIIFRLIAFGAPNGRDLRDQFGYSRSRYRASRRAKPILVPATVAIAENVRGELARVRPSSLSADDSFERALLLSGASARSCVARTIELTLFALP